MSLIGNIYGTIKNAQQQQAQENNFKEQAPHVNEINGSIISNSSHGNLPQHTWTTPIRSPSTGNVNLNQKSLNIKLEEALQAFKDTGQKQGHIAVVHNGEVSVCKVDDISQNKYHLDYVVDVVSKSELLLQMNRLISNYSNSEQKQIRKALLSKYDAMVSSGVTTSTVEVLNKTFSINFVRIDHELKQLEPKLNTNLLL